MHPIAQRTAQSLLTTEQGRSWVRRSMAVFDAPVAAWGSAASAPEEAVQATSPTPLSSWVPETVIQWPTNSDGRSMAGVALHVPVVGSLRSIVAVVDGGAEWYVAWLHIEIIAMSQDDFIDDADQALAQQQLYGSLGSLTGLEWLEAA